MRTVWIQRWTESERGWGQRPDGFSVATEKNKLISHVKDRVKKMRDDEALHLIGEEAPDCYTYADGLPFAEEITDEKFDATMDHDVVMVNSLKDLK